MNQQQITKLYQMLTREDCCGTNAKTFFEKRFFTTKFNSYSSVRDYLLYTTPLLAVRFFADYAKFSNKEREFWLRFNDTWITECKRNKWTACDGLEDYKGKEHILLSNLESIFVTPKGNKIQLTDECHDIESTINHLTDLLYEHLNHEEEEKKRVIEEQHRKIQEAQEAGRRRMEEEAKAKAEAEQQAISSNPIYTMGVEKATDLDSVFVKGNISDIFERRIRTPNDNEARIRVDYKKVNYDITFGITTSNMIIASGFMCFHFFEDVVGNRYIYFDKKPGINATIDKSRLTINSKAVCERILEMYDVSDYIFFSIEQRATNNPDIIVFQITNSYQS